VAATAKTCVFFVIPYKTAVVESLIGVGDRFVAGQAVPRADRRDRTYRSEDESFLLLRGRETDVEVPVSPASVATVSKRIAEFLAQPQATELRLFVVANWKFSLIAGGLLSLLTVLYFLGLAVSIVFWVLRLARQSGRSDPFAPGG
jgi:hypothetical protein